MELNVARSKIEEVIALLQELATAEEAFIANNARCALAYLENCRLAFPEVHLG